jgi:prefoldin subunit 5
MVQMNSHQQRLATLTHTIAHLNARFNELNRLRDQVRKAQRLTGKSQRTVRRKSVFKTAEAAN